MPKYMNREQIDPIEAAIDLCLEESKRVPVVYQGKLYYLYSVQSTLVELVDINEVYVQDELHCHDGHFDFLPQKTQFVFWPEHALEILQFVDLCRKRDDLIHVDVVFAELQDNKMQIILKNQEFPLLATGRVFDFIEDHYEIHTYEEVVDLHD